MEFKDGTNVYTVDGKKAGGLHRVVIDPANQEVTHIVIQKGLLFKADKVIPVEKVASASRERIDLISSVEELEEMSPLEVEEYNERSDAPGVAQSYDPLTGRMLGGLPADHPVIREVKRTIPDDLVAMKEGARVISADDVHVGNVEHVFVDEDSGKITHFIIAQGPVFVTRKPLPIEWIKLITDDEVYLTVESRQLEELPVMEE